MCNCKIDDSFKKAVRKEIEKALDKERQIKLKAVEAVAKRYKAELKKATGNTPLAKAIKAIQDATTAIGVKAAVKAFDTKPKTK